MTNRQIFLNHLAQTSDFPLMLEIEKAEGVYMYGSNGKKYIDLISGIGVSNVGHRHPKVVKAIEEQLTKHLHLMVYGEFVQTPQVKLAEALTKTLPDSLNSVYILNSGSEAVEGALKLAKRVTGRPKIVSFSYAYHGSSHGALSVCGNENLKNKFRPLLPECYTIEFNNFAQLDEIDKNTAAVIVEPIQGEAGVRLPKRDFLKALREKCDSTGALLIFDEIQVGFGRTGKFWAFEHFEVIPDILVCAKGMGGGMPIGAFISSRENMAFFKNNPILGHISTFGGHPLSCEASLATLNTILDDNLLSEVEAKGKLFVEFFQKHPKVKEVRQIGLFIAVEFESFEVLKPIIDRTIENGILTDWFLFCDNCMRIAPPLTITTEEIKLACGKILEVL